MFIRHEFWSFLIVSVLIIACKSQDSETYNACVETVEMARDRDQGNVQEKCTTTWFMSFCGFQQAFFFVFIRPAKVVWHKIILQIFARNEFRRDELCGRIHAPRAATSLADITAAFEELDTK